MTVGDVLYSKQISEKYSLVFVEGEEFIEIRVSPVGDASLEEAEIACASDIRALANSGLLNVERKTDDRFPPDVGGLIDEAAGS